LQIVCLVFVVNGLQAQIPDSTALPVRDSVPSGRGDSAVVDLSGIRISNEGLDAEVAYAAKDSMWFDVVQKQVHLYGSASVKYTTLEIKAGYILLDYAKNEISAEQLRDSTGQLAGLPEFNDGQQTFTATRLRYNFKTRKGIIYEARTKQDDMYVLGTKAKFVGSPSADTTQKSKNIIYNQDAILTTCDAEHPHFGIRTRKLKVIPNKLVVTGLSNLELGGVPTPIIIPFGFFPMTTKRKAGVLIPKDFQGRRQEGLGINDLGWYQPISEHADATLLFRAFTSGTLGASGTVRYNYKYRFTGDVALNYNRRVTEDSRAEKVVAKSFGIRLTHNQDPKAHPSRRLNGSVNIQTNQDQNRNQNDFQSVYQNTLTSNLTFNKTYPGKPYQFSAALRHSQNTLTRQMDITLPSVNFTMQRIFPFRRKVTVGKERWYEKLSLTYSSKFDNSFRTVDTLLFTQSTLENARIGIQHQASSDYTFKLFKYINVSPNIRYEENWYPYTINKTLNDKVTEVYDTTFFPDGSFERILNESKSTYGELETTRSWNFHTFRKFDVGISTNTALFYTKQFRKGWFRGIRHKATPTAGIGFGPDYSKQQDRYFKYYYTDLRPAARDSVRYGIFDEAIYSRPDLGKRNVSLNYSLSNVLEFKHFSSKRDTVLKKRIFENLTFSGSYSLTADSLKWSTVGTGGLFRLFKGLSQLTWNVTFDPYVADEKGQRVNTFMLKEKGRLVRTTQLGFALNTGFSVKQIRDLFGGKSDAQAPGSNTGTQRNSTNSVANTDNLLSLFDNFRISHRISVNRQLIPTGFGTARDTFAIGTNNLSISGSLQLTSKWSIDLGNISYDFPEKRLVYPDIGFTRDLHCWSLSLRWQPDRGTYSFFIGVKPGTLEFLKVPYRKDYFDTGF
jgi:LptD protein